MIKGDILSRDYKDFLEKEPKFRVAYLLKLNYYSSSENEDKFREFIEDNNISRSDVFSFERSLERHDVFHIISRIIKEDYMISLVDLKSCLQSRELNNALTMFLEDIKSCGMLDMNLLEIYKKLQKNIRFVRENSLPSSSEIMDSMSDPFQNDEFISKCLKKLYFGHDTMYIGSSIFLDDDKVPRDDLYDERWKKSFTMKFYAEYISRILKYLSLPDEDRRKYFNDRFLGEIDDKLVHEIKSITVDDLNKLYECCYGEKREFISRVFADRPKLSEFLNYVNLATSTILEHARSRHFYGPFGGGARASIPYTYRIYIHTSPNSKSRLLFLKEYILRCIDAGINYDIKGRGSDDADYISSKDSTVIYVEKIEDLPRVIKILDSISFEYPALIDSFGSPMWNAGRFADSYYALGYGGAVAKGQYYDEFGYQHMGYFETYNGITDKFLEDAYKIYEEQLDKVDRELSDKEKIQLFRRILYEVKRNYHKKEIHKVRELAKKSDKLSLPISCVVTVVDEKRPVKIRKNGACNIINDCYIEVENEELSLLDKLYANRCRSNSMILEEVGSKKDISHC